MEYNFYIIQHGVRGEIKTQKKIFPINTSTLKIVHDKADNRIFFRKKLSGNPVLIKADYDYIKQIESADFYSTLYFKIDKLCEGSYQEIYMGYFNILNIDFDSDSCTCIINNIKTYDEYTCLLDYSKNKFNFFDITDIYTVTANILPFQIETLEVIDSKYCMGEYNNNCFLPYTSNNYPVSVAGGTLYDSQGYILLKQKYAVINTATQYFKLTATFQRFYINTLNDINNNPVIPTIVLPASTWVNTGNVSINGLNGTHWIAPRDNFAFTFDIEGCNNFTLNINVDLSAYEQTFNKNRKFIDIMNHISSICGYSFKSDLFTKSINPVTNIINRLPNLMMAAKYDTKYTTLPEPMSVLNYTFEDIENILTGMFNAYWYIEGDSLRVEHISWFTNYPVYADILKDSKTFNKYHYDFSSLPHFEKWKFNDHSLPDFVGTDIIYNIYTSYDLVKDYNLQNICTELVTVGSTTAVLDEGFVLLDTNGSEVKSDVGALTGQSLVNMALSVANLQNDYFKWDRPLVSGLMNNKTTVFNSTKKMKKQNKFDVSKCTCVLPNWNNKIKTNLGLGYIEGFEFDLINNILSCEISYDL